MGFQSYRINQPRYSAGGSLAHEIEVAMENDPRKPKLESVKENHFVYSVGKGRQASFYKVPYTINEYGILNLDFTKEVQTNQSQGDQILKQAATRAVEHLARGENDMEKEILGPPHLNVKKDKPEKDLKTMQEEADSKGILLPPHLNKTENTNKQGQEDENMLLPLHVK